MQHGSMKSPEKHRVSCLRPINYMRLLRRLIEPTAVFSIYGSVCKRLLFARRRESFICAGVAGFAPAPFRLLAASALTQLRSACADIPCSRTTLANPWPSLTRWTTASLNSAVYDCCGTLNVPDFLPFHRVYARPLAKRKFRGSSKYNIRSNFFGCSCLHLR